MSEFNQAEMAALLAALKRAEKPADTRISDAEAAQWEAAYARHEEREGSMFAPTDDWRADAKADYEADVQRGFDRYNREERPR